MHRALVMPLHWQKLSLRVHEFVNCKEQAEWEPRSSLKTAESLHSICDWFQFHESLSLICAHIKWRWDSMRSPKASILWKESRAPCIQLSQGLSYMALGHEGNDGDTQLRLQLPELTKLGWTEFMLLLVVLNSTRPLATSANMIGPAVSAWPERNCYLLTETSL